MPPDPAVILTTHCIEEQIPHNSMYQQIIEQKQMISSLQNQLSAQQDKMSTLEVNVKRLTDSFNEKINEKVAEGTSTLCEKVEKLEEVISSINSRITLSVCYLLKLGLTLATSHVKTTKHSILYTSSAERM